MDRNVASCDSDGDNEVLQKKLIDAVKDGTIEKVTEICMSLPTNFNMNSVFEKPYYGARKGTPLLHLACSARNSGEILIILVKYGGSLWSNKLDGLNLFHYACKKRNLEAIQFILGECQDVFYLHTLSEDGYDALFYAIEFWKNDPEEGKKVIELLLLQGRFNINRFRKNGSTEVLKAVVENRCELASMLCKLGADVNLGYHSSKKAIHWASEQSGYHDMIQILVDHGANKNEVWRHCQRPIHMALKHGLTKNAEVLLRSGVDISGSVRLNNPKYLWISTFCLAARRCPSLIPEFLARGANPNEIHYTSGLSVLGFVIENGGKREAIKSLIQAGADIAKGCNGKSALQSCNNLDQILAFVDGSIPLKTLESELDTNLLKRVLLEDYSSEEAVVEDAKLLLSKGAALDDPRNGTISFLFHHVEKRNYKVAEFLIENGIKINQKKKNGNTTLHIICKMESSVREPPLTLAKKLLAAGSSVEEVNNAGKTPLLIALRTYYRCPQRQTRRTDLIKCLLDNGADINVQFPNKKKSTLLYAIESHDIEMTKVMLNAGYNINKKEADGELPIFHCFPLDKPEKRELLTVMLETGNVSKSVDSKGTSLLERVFLDLVTVPHDVGGVFYNSGETKKKKVKINAEIIPVFSLLLKKNADPNTAQEGEDSLLTKAIRFEAEEIVTLLIKAGASITHIGENKNTPLDVCCRLSKRKTMKGSQEKIYRLKEEGLRILNILFDNNLPLDAPNAKGKYPLEVLMLFDNTEAEIQTMLSKGADPNKYDVNEECPLVNSVYGNPSVTLALLKAGADAQTTATDGRSVYDLFTERAFYDDNLSCLDERFAAEIQMRALVRNQTPLVKIEDICNTLTIGKKIKPFLGQLQKTPAIKVSGKSMLVKFGDSFSCWKTVRWLEQLVKKGEVRNLKAKDDQIYWRNIKQKVDIRRNREKEEDDKGQSTACCEVIKTLIEANGVDVNSKTSPDLLPLCVAVRLGSLPLLNFLLEKNANPNLLEAMDETPLSLALIEGDMDIVKALVEAKSNVNHVGVLPGRSAEQKESVLSRLLDEKGSCARLAKRRLLMNYLIQNGASINFDKEGVDSPLIKAVRLLALEKTEHQDMSSVDLVPELLKLGSEINHRGESLFTALHVCCQQLRVPLCSNIFIDVDSTDSDSLEEDEEPFLIEDEGENENIEEEKDSFDTIFDLLLNSEASVNVQAKSGATPVHIAVKRRLCFHIPEMLNRNFEANTKDASGVTCVMLAAEWGDKKTIKDLIKRGADIKLEDECGNTALHYLCSNGLRMELLAYFVNLGSDINAVNKDGYSPLNTYVKEAERLEEKYVIDLISKGADPNCCPGGCESPLTNALKRKKYEIAKLLLKNGALVNHVSESGITALSVAVSQEKAAYKSEREEMVNCLLEAGADTNILTVKTASPLCNLLSSPFSQDTMTILSNLLKHNADPNIGIENPLCFASKVHPDAVELLLKAGANVNRKGSDGNTPLVECLYSKNGHNMVKSLIALIEAGADTNIASNSGKYPLEIVLESSVLYVNAHFVDMKSSRPKLRASICSEEQTAYHLKELVTLLLDAGAKCDQCTMGNDSMLHTAVAIGEPDVVKLLITHGADVNHIGENQETPLHRYLKKETQNKSLKIIKPLTKKVICIEPIMDSGLNTVLDVLLTCEANPSTKDGDGNIPLRLALKTSTEDFLKLLAAGADPFYEEENMFIECVFWDDHSFLNILLQERGAEYISENLFSSFWEIQSDASIYKNRVHIATVTKQMLSSPQELNVDGKNLSGKTPLLYFCDQNEGFVVEKILERGADLNITDNEGRTALHALFHSKSSDTDAKYHILTLLMKRNPDVKIKDATGQTVFQKARMEYQEVQHTFSMYKHTETDYKWLSVLMKEMLNAGENCEKPHLSSLLLLASQRVHFGFMTSLVEKGAHLSDEINGKGVLHLCWPRRYQYERRRDVSYEDCVNFLRIYKKHGGRLDEVDKDGNTPLMLFLKNGINDFDGTQNKMVDLRDEIVSLLACDKSTVRKHDSKRLSAIHIVSSKGWLSTMKILVSKGADIFEKDDTQNTCLHLCIDEAPDEFLHDMVVYLVENGIAVNQLNNKEQSPLFTLVARGASDELKPVTTVEYLLKSGALPNQHIKRNNPLVAAIRSADIKVIALLLDYHADVNDIEDGPTALHVFFRCFRDYKGTEKDDIEKMIQRIMEMGATVNNKDYKGRTVLHLAIKAFGAINNKCKPESVIQQLLDFGADVNAVDNSGQTPLSVICETGSLGSVDQASLGCFLLSKGADPNIDFALNQCMRTIDFNGLSAEWKAFIQSLIQNGADPNLYRDNKPPILMAIKSGHQDIVKVLLEKGANIHSCDRDENTCLHLACDIKEESSKNEIASLVLEHGCSVNKPNRYGIIPLSNLVKGMAENTESMKIDQTETMTVAKIDLSLFNKLICGGAEMDPATQSTSLNYYRKSILATLLKKGFFGAAVTLLKCGYNYNLDKDFKSMDVSHLESSTILVEGKRYKRIDYEEQKNGFLNFLKTSEVEEESSLSCLCRNTIRSHLVDVGQGAEIESKIMVLPIPERIKTYLSLREDVLDFEQIQIEENESSAMDVNLQTLLGDYYDIYMNPYDTYYSDVAYYGRDDSDIDEYIHYYRDSDSDDYYY
ncbi:uncharacterized protein LOC134274369 isoform X2 [Saccostrea cucullata]|uniref:uncharacterized protein LOC134274369 isoform X2 n=1 Tax=Saccostrea cuccullata TaxID=36930 RepID=UPI002ED0F6FE